jgi:hypothetical protein
LLSSQPTRTAMTMLFATPSATPSPPVPTALILPMPMPPLLLAHARALLGRRVVVAAESRLRQDPSFPPWQAPVPFLLRCCTAAQESLRPRGTAPDAFTAMGHMDTDTDMLTGAETGPHTHTRAPHNHLTTLFCTLTAAQPPSKRAQSCAGIVR